MGRKKRKYSSTSSVQQINELASSSLSAELLLSSPLVPEQQFVTNSPPPTTTTTTNNKKMLIINEATTANSSFDGIRCDSIVNGNNNNTLSNYNVAELCSSNSSNNNDNNDNCVLSEHDITKFQEDGFVVLQNAFECKLADEARERIWLYLEENHNIYKNDTSTWINERQGIPHCFNSESPWTEILQSKRLQTAINQLCGGPDSWVPFGLGWWLIGFPGFYPTPSTTATVPVPAPTPERWDIAAGRWHVDGSYYRHYLNSRESGLSLLFLFSTIILNAGGTALCVGSHKVTAQVLYDVGNDGITGGALSREVLRRITTMDKNNSNSYDKISIQQVIGNAGDVILCHPLLLHARSKNLAPTNEEKFVRFLCHPGVQLTKPKRIDNNIKRRKKNKNKKNNNEQNQILNDTSTQNQCYSPVEQAIINAIRR